MPTRSTFLPVCPLMCPYNDCTAMHAKSLHNRRRPYQKSGVYTLKRAVQVLGSRAMPPSRTALGRALREWRESLVADLGGTDAVTTQQLALVDMAVRSKLLVDSVDAYVLGMASPINKRSRCLYPVARERQALVSQLQSLLRDLGLERRVKSVPDLKTYLATTATGGAGSPDRRAGGHASPPISPAPSNTDGPEADVGDSNP